MSAMQKNGKTKGPEEISVRATLEKAGVSAGFSASVKSRAISAFERLLGAWMGIPAAFAEQIESRIQNSTETEARIQKAATDRLVSAIANDEEFNTIAAELVISSGLRPMANRIRVAEAAIRELADHGDATATVPDPEDSEAVVDDDWMNHFTSYAEKASSEKVRDLWGRVLAGEIRRAGSFSLSCLRLLSELDRRMAKTFQTAVEHRMQERYILKPKESEMKGQLLDDHYFLLESGFLNAIEQMGGVSHTITPDDNGVGYMEEQSLLLFVEARKPVSIPVILLTRAGRELASLLPPPDPLAVLEKVGERIRDNVEFMEIQKIVVRTEKHLRTKPFKTLKQR